MSNASYLLLAISYWLLYAWHSRVCACHISPSPSEPYIEVLRTGPPFVWHCATASLCTTCRTGCCNVSLIRFLRGIGTLPIPLPRKRVCRFRNVDINGMWMASSTLPCRWMVSSAQAGIVLLSSIAVRRCCRQGVCLYLSEHGP